MRLYKSLITKLVNQESDDPQDLFLTFYYPYDHSHSLRHDYKLAIKSFIYENLRKDEKIKDYTKTQEIIFKKAHEELDKVKNLEKGFALFVKLTPDEMEKGHVKTIKKDNFNLITLSQEPKQESYVGKTYDLDQLVSIFNSTKKALILNLDERNAHFYLMREDDLYPIERIRNKFHIAGTKDFQPQTTPRKKTSSNKGIYYGSGPKDVEKKQDEFLKKLIHDVVDFTKENQENHGYNYLVTFHSQKFNKFIDDVRNGLTGLSKFDTIFVQETTKNEQDLVKHAHKEINKMQKHHKEKLFDHAKNDPKKFTVGWSDVAGAVRLQKIKTLFTTPVAKMSGYICKNGLPSLEKQSEDCQKVKNIAPWIVKNVIKAGGEVIVFPDKEDFAAAELWY